MEKVLMTAVDLAFRALESAVGFVEASAINALLIAHLEAREKSSVACTKTGFLHRFETVDGKMYVCQDGGLGVHPSMVKPTIDAVTLDVLPAPASRDDDHLATDDNGEQWHVCGRCGAWFPPDKACLNHSDTGNHVHRWEWVAGSCSFQCTGCNVLCDGVPRADLDEAVRRAESAAEAYQIAARFRSQWIQDAASMRQRAVMAEMKLDELRRAAENYVEWRAADMALNAELKEKLAQWETAWDDKDDQWTVSIKAAFPTNSGSHDEYGQAMTMVGNRRSKGALVALVNWLLVRCK
jgi:hypothetical protein